ncbi:elongation factor Ts [Eggerthellaceae bacterium zg-1084]|uniref:Elongation factor Ts n=1 Tax=Berryella wangjianweii TaxID=2734634 RepID=A0A6M8J2N2_9ACTN|nr:translation elongation factor Ts [Berryella wangjianweii]NPD31604.1 elongation factor Ts [Berryella wangjianweii]NPD32901.1 elongation factor Ts [Eggerthellaceae bacterium zg-997]QKF07774.1 elongation factor Ts [Berryella wangjianweii]
MAAITAAMVKELREITGAGMMECKKALNEADGNMEAAVDVLRTRGLAAAAKKAGRATNEGTVAALVAEDGTAGVVLELNCETDFVGMNEKFKAYADRIAGVALANSCSDVEALKELKDGDEVVADIITDAVHVLGENTNLARVQVLAGGAVCSYIHMGGKIGVLVGFELEGIEPTNADFVAYGRNVAMQVAAISPVAANRDAVPADVVEHERAIYIAQAAESGKPEAIQQKMAEGRLEKFYKENCLTEQDYVKNPEQTIAQYTAEVAKQLGGSIKVVDFVRFALGE